MSGVHQARRIVLYKMVCKSTRYILHFQRLLHAKMCRGRPSRAELYAFRHMIYNKKCTITHCDWLTCITQKCAEAGRDQIYDRRPRRLDTPSAWQKARQSGIYVDIFGRCWRKPSPGPRPGGVPTNFRGFGTLGGRPGVCPLIFRVCPLRCPLSAR